MKNTFMQRYLEPLWENKKFYFGALLHPINKWVFPILTIHIIKLITWFIELGQYESAKQYIYILIGLTIVYYILLYVTLKLYYLDSMTVIKRFLQTKYIEKYITLDNNDTERYGLWRFVAVIKQWIGTRCQSLQNLFFQGWYLFITLFLSFFLIAATNQFFAWVYLGLLFCSLIISWKLDVWAVYRRNKRRDMEHANSRSVIRLIMSKFEVLQSWKLNQELSSLREDLHEADTYNQRTWNYVWMILNVPEFFIKAIFVWVLFTVWLWVIDGEYTFADFIALTSVLIIVERSVRQLSRFFKDTTKDISYVKKIFDTYDGMKEVVWYDDWEQFVPQWGSITIRNMTYWYWTWWEKEQYVFDGFDLSLQGGKKTALVWISGSWKSTLVKLIAWYLRPDEGSILIDDQDLASMALKTYYPHIWYLTQDPSIFDGSVRENLTYAVTDNVPTEKVEEAIRLASCDFIYDLPNWLDTQIWERGVRLSWGQRQRLAIAKIFLKNPKIIILDEPTSALDSFSEEAITEAMHKLFENRTVIIIAHRLQTVKEADDIILLGNQKSEIWGQKATLDRRPEPVSGSSEVSSIGERQVSSGSQILERGTHAELVALWGQYARMLEVQTGF